MRGRLVEFVDVDRISEKMSVDRTTVVCLEVWCSLEDGSTSSTGIGNGAHVPKVALICKKRELGELIDSLRALHFSISRGGNSVTPIFLGAILGAYVRR